MSTKLTGAYVKSLLVHLGDDELIDARDFWRAFGPLNARLVAKFDASEEARVLEDAKYYNIHGHNKFEDMEEAITCWGLKGLLAESDKVWAYDEGHDLLLVGKDNGLIVWLAWHGETAVASNADILEWAEKRAPAEVIKYTVDQMTRLENDLDTLDDQSF